ncbi:MAG: hypothetical protein ABI268_10220 [Rhodanobacter sp.]
MIIDRHLICDDVAHLRPAKMGPEDIIYMHKDALLGSVGHHEPVPAGIIPLHNPALQAHAITPVNIPSRDYTEEP